MLIIVILFILSASTTGQCGVIQSLYVTNEVVPTKEQAFQLTCQVIGDIDQNIFIYLTDPLSNNEQKKCDCFGALCLKYNDKGHSCNITGTTKRVYVDIAQAARDDEGVWICRTVNTTTANEKNVTIMVYTLPSSISFDGIFQQPQLLWNNEVSMACKTDQCTYKDPIFTWYYNEAGGTKSVYTAVNAVPSSSSSGCSDSEMIYSSALTLPRYTTALGNIDLTTKFQCRMSFAEITFSKDTGETPDVSFAVQVSSVTIKQGSNILTTGQNIQVDENVLTNFTCTTGTSKPPSTIIWFVGSTKQMQTGTSFSYTPHNGDHSTDIFCAAFNIQSENQAFQSQKPKLFVRVQVASATLKQGNTEPSQTLTVTESVAVTLTCDLGVSRPAPTVDWYIGETRKQSSTSATYTLKAVNADHDKVIYCKAYNLQTETDGVLSATPKLYVRVQVSSVTLWQGNIRPTQTLTVTAGFPVNLTCVPGTSRPDPTIEWYIEGTRKQSSTNTVYSLDAVNSDHDKLIYCKAFNLQNSSQGVVSSQPNLYVKVQVSTVTLKFGSTAPSQILTVTAGTPVTLTCEPGVSRPSPMIDWYIGTSRVQTLTRETYRLNASDNDHDKAIYCKAYNLQSESNGVVSASHKLYVRVQVSTVSLKQGNSPVNGTVTVTAGTPESFTCAPGTSRPSPTIAWYIDSQKKQASTNTVYNLTATNDDHGKEIYCKAYNLQSEFQGVLSGRPHLYVRVQVTNVTLTQGSSTISGTLTVTAGSSVSLTCVPGTSRPAPTIQWYIGSILKQNSTSTTYSLSAVNNDHDEVIYCKAYNLQTVNQAVTSSSPKLYVRVNAAAPTITNGTLENVILLENDAYTIQCQSTHTRPASIMSWKLGSNVTMEETSKEGTTAENLIYVISTISITPRRQNNGSELICESHIPGQSPATETIKTVIVFWRPDVPAVATVDQGFPWIEGQKGELVCNSSNAGNPASSVIWIDDTGSNINQQNYIIGNLSFTDHSRKVKCQMENKFTREKKEEIESHEITLNVQFSPKIFTPDIVVAGKPNQNMTAHVPFYENPNYQSVLLLKNDTQLLNETTSKSSSKYELVTTEAMLNKSITGATSVVNGSLLDFVVMDLEEADFTTYFIRIGNTIGAANAKVTVRAESSPLAPTNFRLMEQKGSTLIFYWENNFNGGYPQTFKIEVAKANAENWLTKKTIEESDSNSKLDNGSYIANVSGLQPGDYGVRLSAENKIGSSGLVMLSATINIPSADKLTQSPPIAAAVGGGVGAAVLIMVVVVVVILLRRRSSGKGDDYNKNILKTKRHNGANESDDTAEIQNPMYESADTVQLPISNNDVYAQVNKKANQPKSECSKDLYAEAIKTKKPENRSPKSADVYSSPVKKGKGKKAAVQTDVYSKPVKKEKDKDKKGKTQKDKKKGNIDKQVDGSLYENAEDVKDGMKSGENVYENPSCSLQDEKPSRRKNDDGLIYIDVELPTLNNAKNQKAVIHGEDKTIYADVAYGQVGEQLPESNEEEKPRDT